MNGAHFENRHDHSKMKSHWVRLDPKSNMAGVLRTEEFEYLPTEKTICTQDTDRVEATSQEHLELPAAGQGGKVFPWNRER